MAAAGDASAARGRPRRHPRLVAAAAPPPTAALSFLLLVVVACLAATALAQPKFDCALGCALSSEVVCGDDGLVYAGECLAFCAGARAVACGGGGSGGGSSSGTLKSSSDSAASAASSDAPSPPPPPALGRLLDLSRSSDFAVKRVAGSSTGGTSGGGTLASRGGGVGSALPPTPAFTRDDIQRYADQGFALLGPARFESFKPQMPAIVRSGGAGGGGGGGGNDAGNAPAAESDVRAVRVASDTGLVYATQKSVFSGGGSTAGVAAMASLLAGGGAPPKGWRPVRAGRVASSSASASASGNNSTTPTTTTGAAISKGAGMNDAAWLEVTTSAAAKVYPYSAVASVSVGGWGCSGARISKWSVLTAGHCVYDFDKARLQKASTMKVTMARFKGSNGRLQSPYRSSSVRSYTYFKDFAKGREFSIGGLDVAVMQLSTDPGNTGTLGLESREAACGLAKCPSSSGLDGGDGGGVTPTNTSPATCPADAACTTPLDSAAYPGDTKDFGRLFRYRGLAYGRATLDENAQDGVVMSACFTPDSAAQPVLPRIEPGMSGSALWTVGGSSAAPAYRVVGVLSGLEVESFSAPYTCSGVFGYTEVTTRVFDMVSKAAAGYDKARGRATGQKGV